MAQTFPVGQAPWETQNAAPPPSFPVGQAPWETSSPDNTQVHQEESNNAFSQPESTPPATMRPDINPLERLTAKYVPKIAGAIAPTFKEIGYDIAGIGEQKNINPQGIDPKLFANALRVIKDPTVPFERKQKIVEMLKDQGYQPPEELLRTPLQKVGSHAQTLLNFAPVATLGSGATAGAKALGMGAKAADITGKVLAGGATGYGFDVAQNLQAGKTGKEAAKPGLGTALGVTVPLAIEGGKALANTDAAHHFRAWLAGINPQEQNILKELPDATKFDKYVNAAKIRTQDVRAASPFGLAADELDDAGKIVKQELAKAGEAVGAAKKASSAVNVGLNPGRVSEDQIDQEVLTKFANEVEDRFGLDLRFDFKNGSPDYVTINQVPGRDRVISAADKARLKQVFEELIKARGANGYQITDILSNLDDMVNYKVAPATQYGIPADPLEGLVKETRNDLSGALRSIDPNLAAANDKYSQLKDLDKFIGSMAGKDMQRGELLLRRVFSGDKGREALNVLDQIKDVTGKDLVQDAVLARFAIESYGDKAQKTLLQQAIEAAAEGKVGVATKLFQTPGMLARETIARPESVARGIIERGAAESTIANPLQFPGDKLLQSSLGQKASNAVKTVSERVQGMTPTESQSGGIEWFTKPDTAPGNLLNAQPLTNQGTVQPKPGMFPTFAPETPPPASSFAGFPHTSTPTGNALTDAIDSFKYNAQGQVQFNGDPALGKAIQMIDPSKYQNEYQFLEHMGEIGMNLKNASSRASFLGWLKSFDTIYNSLLK